MQETMSTAEPGVLQRTIVLSGPSRSGKTLINRLFDSHPEVINIYDEAYFWEHVYSYQERGLEPVLLDIFRRFDPAELIEGFKDRDILPWVDGKYSQLAIAHKQELELDFDASVFLRGLEQLPTCASISDVWACLVSVYAQASGREYSSEKAAFIQAADHGKSILGARSTLGQCKCLFIMRNPFYAIDSQKKSREIGNWRVLHPFNLGETIQDYRFFWLNRTRILDEQTLLIRYEELVTDPERVMRSVAAHVGVTFTEGLLNPTLQGDSWSGLSAFTTTAGIDPSIVERDIQVLTERELGFIDEHLGELVEHFGYSRPPIPKTRLKQASGSSSH